MQISADCDEDKSLIYLISLAISYVVCFWIVSFGFAATLVFVPYRFLVGIYLSYKYKCKIEFASGFETIYCIDSLEAPLHIQGYQLFRGKLDLEKLRERVNEKFLHKAGNPRFRQIMKHELGYYFLIPNKKLKLENHVLLYPGAPPRNMSELNNACSELCTSLPVQMNIFWQIFLIPLPDDFTGHKFGPKFLLFINCHQFLVDGLKFTGFFNILYDTAPDDSYMHPKKKASFMNLLKYFIQLPIVGPLKVVAEFLVRERHYLLGAPLSGVKLVSISDAIPFERIKRIATRMESNVNDVLTTCAVGALRSFFLSEKKPIPSLIRFVSPMSLNSEFSGINQSSLVSLALPVHADTSIGRLRKTKEAIDRAESEPKIFLGNLIAKFCVNRAPSFTISSVMNSTETTGVIGNLPGVEKPENVFGCELIQFVALMSSRGLSGITITSAIANGYVTFALKVDTAIMKNQDRLDLFVGFITKEFLDLESVSEKVKSH